MAMLQAVKCGGQQRRPPFPSSPPTPPPCTCCSWRCCWPACTPLQAVKVPLSGGATARDGGRIRTPWHLWHLDREQTGITGFAVMGQRIPRRYVVVKGERRQPPPPMPASTCRQPASAQRPPARLPLFLFAGFGETDQGSGTDPFETGAHDLGGAASDGGHRVQRVAILQTCAVRLCALAGKRSFDVTLCSPAAMEDAGIHKWVPQPSIPASACSLLLPWACCSVVYHSSLPWLAASTS